MPSYLEMLRLIVQLREADLRAAESFGESAWTEHAREALQEARDLVASESSAGERRDAGRKEGRRH